MNFILSIKAFNYIC